MFFIKFIVLFFSIKLNLFAIACHSHFNNEQSCSSDKTYSTRIYSENDFFNALKTYEKGSLRCPICTASFTNVVNLNIINKLINV